MNHIKIVDVRALHYNNLLFKPQETSEYYKWLNNLTTLDKNYINQLIRLGKKI